MTIATGEIDYITLRVAMQGYNWREQTRYRLKMTATMEKLKKSHSVRLGVPNNLLRFLFNGKQINDDDTPISLEMVHDDLIEVYQEQTAGR